MEEHIVNRDSEPLLELDYKLTGEEIFATLRFDACRGKKTKKWVQSGVLLLMTAYLLTAFFMDGMKNISSLMLAVAAVTVLAAVWLMPPWQMKRQAEILAEDGKRVRLRLYPGKIEFGWNDRSVYSLNECKSALFHDLLILEIGRDMVCVPRRVTDGEGYRLLLDVFGEKTADGRPSP